MADATVRQYGNPAIIAELDALIAKIIGFMEQGMSFREAYKKAVKGTKYEPGGGEGRDLFPFTGLEVAVTLTGALVLIGSGLLIRRAAR